jgi:hypothetical protein
MASFIINPYSFKAPLLPQEFTETLDGEVTISDLIYTDSPAANEIETLDGEVVISDLVYTDSPAANETETLDGEVAISDVVYEALSRDAGNNDVDHLIYFETTSSGAGFIDTTRAPAGMKTTGARNTDATWGLFAGVLTNQNASYSLNLGTLAVSQYVQLDCSLGYLETGMRAGFSLETITGVIRANIFYQGGHASDTWKVIDSTNSVTPKNVTGPTTGYATSNWGIDATYQTIRFTVRAGNTYDISFGGTDITNASRTIAATDIARVRFFVSTAGVAGIGSNWDQFFNKLVVG